ncbi:tetraacyldisaccharide 4'-kinase [Rapidithrix thailandica]
MFLRLLLFPFAILYRGLTGFYHYSYDKGWKPSIEFDLPVISVGNITVGGTGKTPHIEYLIRLLKDKYSLATLSRGYKRKSKGFLMAGEQSSAKEMGDEPYQFYAKYGKEIHVAVGEERAMAIPAILNAVEDIQLVLLDDAFQHRKVKPGLNILLTDYKRPFYDDFLLPAGRLRERRDGAKRADMVIVSKCPDKLPEQERAQVSKKIQPYTQPDTPVYFTGLKYTTPCSLKEKDSGESFKNILLLTGIAHTERLVEDLQEQYTIVEHLKYRDHAEYTPSLLKSIRTKYQSLKEKLGDLVILTTEKDAVKLQDSSLDTFVSDLPFYYLPIEVYFLQNGEQFDARVLKYIEGERSKEA